MSDKFDKPLGVWIDEEVNVRTFEPEVDEKNKTVKIVAKDKKYHQKTIYVDSKPSTIVCKEHIYFCADKGKYLFKCRHCAWHRVALPVTFKFDPETGILTRRLTGERV